MRPAPVPSAPWECASPPADKINTVGRVQLSEFAVLSGSSQTEPTVRWQAGLGNQCQVRQSPHQVVHCRQRDALAEAHHGACCNDRRQCIPCCSDLQPMDVQCEWELKLSQVFSATLATPSGYIRATHCWQSCRWQQQGCQREPSNAARHHDLACRMPQTIHKSLHSSARGPEHGTLFIKRG